MFKKMMKRHLSGLGRCCLDHITIYNPIRSTAKPVLPVSCQQHTPHLQLPRIFKKLTANGPCCCWNSKYLKMERESARLYPPLQLSHWFLQRHNPLGWARWVRLLWLVTQREGWRQLQQGCHSAGTCNTRTVQGCNKYSCGRAEQSLHIKSLRHFLFISAWHSAVTAIF